MGIGEPRGDVARAGGEGAQTDPAGGHLERRGAGAGRRRTGVVGADRAGPLVVVLGAGQGEPDVVLVHDVDPRLVIAARGWPSVLEVK